MNNKLIKRNNTDNKFDLPISFKSYEELTLMEEKVRDFVFKATSHEILKREFSEEYLYGNDFDGNEGTEELIKIHMFFEDFRNFFGLRSAKDLLDILKKMEQDKYKYKLDLLALEKDGKLNYDRKIESNGETGLILDVKEDKEGKRKKFTFLIPKSIVQMLSTNYNYTVLTSSLSQDMKSKYSYLFMKEIMYHVKNGKKKWSIEDFRKELKIPTAFDNSNIRKQIIGKIKKDFENSDINLKEPIYTYSKPGEGKKTITHIEFRYSLKNKYSLKEKLYYYKKFLSEEVEYENFNKIFEFRETKFNFKKISDKKTRIVKVKNGFNVSNEEYEEIMEYLWDSREFLYRHEDEDGFEQVYFYECRVIEPTMTKIEYTEIEFDLFFNTYIQKCKDREKKSKIEKNNNEDKFDFDEDNPFEFGE